MSLEGHTEAVWCVQMMVDQGLMLTGFSLTFSVSKNIAGRYCKMHKLKLANVLTMFSMMLYFQLKYVQFDVIQFWGRNIKNYGLNHVLFFDVLPLSREHYQSFCKRAIFTAAKSI